MIKAIGLDDGAYRIDWTDGHSSVYHFIWLRDNCSCSRCGDHRSGSRFQSFLNIPEHIVPTGMTFSGSELNIIWPDQHDSRYCVHWLRDKCYSHVGCRKRRPSATLWNADLQRLPEIDYPRLSHDRTELLHLFEAVTLYGFVVVKNMGTHYGEIEVLTKMLGYVRNTHFGPVTDLRLRSAGLHLSDFPTHILPHTDETYRYVPTGINIFHCLTPSNDGGGVSTLVDSHYLAHLLRESYPEAFDTLTHMPIQHERNAQGEILRSHLPSILLDSNGDVTEVRLNERTMSALAVPPDSMMATYSALRQAFRLAYDLSNRIEYHLKAGEALVFDNLRVLHGRTAFSGDRLIRQSNVFRDEFYARFEYLRETITDQRAH